MGLQPCPTESSLHVRLRNPSPSTVVQHWNIRHKKMSTSGSVRLQVMNASSNELTLRTECHAQNLNCGKSTAKGALIKQKLILIGTNSAGKFTQMMNPLKSLLKSL